MGGKGETVSYTRIRSKARTKKQRDNLKRTIVRMINSAVTPISIIALIEDVEVEGKGKGAKSKKKRGGY